MTEPIRSSEGSPLPPVRFDERALRELVQTTTPARLLAGRAGAAYRTATQLSLRADHAAAQDAVQAEFEMHRDWPAEFVERYNPLEVTTQAAGKAAFLLRPDWGRRLAEESRQAIAATCPKGVDVQIAVGDGLSAVAVAVQVPHLLPLLSAELEKRALSTGRLLVVRHCRVGVMNDVGDLLSPSVIVLLIGERPGLATAESLSAYLGYRPCAGKTDAHRNLISNIHARGVPTDQAAQRIAALAAKLIAAQDGGVRVKEG